MFQKNVDELFSSMSNTFGIADDILNADFEKLGKDHNETLEKMLQVCQQINLKLKQDKYLFMCISIPFFHEIISLQGVNLDATEVQMLTDMSPWKTKWNCSLSWVQ